MNELTTDTGISITRFVDMGMTKVFESEKQAIKAKNEGKSYYYSIFKNGKTTGLYGVPK